jgi:hypothetical protein
MNPNQKTPLPKAAQLRIQRLLVRLGMFAVLALSLWLLWWSLFVRLAPVHRQFQEKTRDLSELADQVDKLKLQWPAPRLEQLAAQYQDAQGLLFADPEAVADWAKGIPLQAAPMGLEAAIQLGAPQAGPEPAAKLSVTRASLNLSPSRTAGITNTPYQRLLTFTGSLAESERRIDLLELSVSGNSNSIQQASVVVRIWSPEKVSK